MYKKKKKRAKHLFAKKAAHWHSLTSNAMVILIIIIDGGLDIIIGKSLIKFRNKRRPNKRRCTQRKLMYV